MAELRVRSVRKSRASYHAVVTNLGPDTVILSSIKETDDDVGFFVGEPLHRDDLELFPFADHRFMVAPTLGNALPLEVDITFTDDSGKRTKTYPIYI